MKNAYFLFLLLCFAQTGRCQDFCKQIKREVSDDKFYMNFFSPFSEAKMPAVRVTRSIDTNPEDDGYDNFYIIFRMTRGGVDSLYIKGADGKLIERKEKNFMVEFDDKSRIVSDTVQINHDITDDKAEVIRTIFFPVNAATINDFTHKKIVKFWLMGYEQSFRADSATAVMNYVKCMRAEKEVE